jgi:hypothetical protein
MSLNNFSIVFFVVAFLLTVLFYIKFVGHWQILDKWQRWHVILLLPVSVGLGFVLGFITLVLFTSIDYLADLIQWLLAFIAILALFSILIAFNVLIDRIRGKINRSKMFFVLIGIAILAAFIYSPFMSYETVSICDGIQQREVSPLIQAMETYKIDTGIYPEDFSDLTPKYAKQIPEPFCLKPYAWLDIPIYYPNYTILQCEREQTFVVFSSPYVQSVHIYNSSTKEWRVTDYYDIYYNESCH